MWWKSDLCVTYTPVHFSRVPCLFTTLSGHYHGWKKGGGTNSDYYYYENQPLCLSVSLRPRLTSSDIWQDSFHSSPFRDTSNSIQFRSMAFEVFSQLHSIKYHSICYILKPDFMWGVWLATNVWVWMKLLCIFRNFSQGQKKKSWDFKNVSTNSISDQQNFLWRKCIWTENMSKGSILCCLNNSRGAFKVQAFPRGICDPITSSLSFLVYIQIAPLQRDAPELLSRINWGHIKAPSPSSHAEAVFTKYESNLMDWLLVEGKSSEHFIYLEVSQFFRLFSS